jgi:hypothetical protein
VEEQVYHDMIEQQKKHWWFRARRTILDKISLAKTAIGALEKSDNRG